MAYELDGINQIEFEELKEVIKNDDDERIVIDVREPEEYEEAHIPKIPLIPMQSIPNVIEEFDKSKEYVFVCRSGTRSQNVAMFFKQHGFNKVTNYAGGMLSWAAETNQGRENIVEKISDLYKK
ncbi:rhodanese-like domain-containing protein [Desertibacillus haloalkaliphilus]|nr:rhodanese-like domain-containing protein [Desertibacillus haloalkaliphilus]